MRRIPFLKILLPFMGGIVFAWETGIPPKHCAICMIIGIAAFLLFTFLPVFRKFRFYYIQGLFIFLAFFSFGALWMNVRDALKDLSFTGNRLLVTLEEPLSEKPNSYKSIASAEHGKIIIYFSKDSSSRKLGYGSRLLIRKKLQPIRNFGNPGSFDYRRYCYFQGISHQVYLAARDVIALPGNKKNWLKQFVFVTKEKILSILEENISGERELGLAEALLIGYKDDLDKTLVRAYSNTGVVHVIAISGLHLGLIYWLLVKLLAPLKKVKRLRWLAPVTIIISLWFFSILAGAQPSVLRSALMFTCIVCGENLSKRTSIYNTLCVSAFILLCWNPFWLWDVGFQLSYSAVLSIVLFMKPVYNWFYIKNRILDAIWKLNAVTISAQVLTFPLCLYHFHQFPNFFLITNLVAVPLSSLVLLLEILLCATHFFPTIALNLGRLIRFFVYIMNEYIQYIDQLPFSTWGGLNVSLPQTILLYLVITSGCIWLMVKIKTSLLVCLGSLAIYMLLQTGLLS